MPKRTYQPKKNLRQTKQGFLSRMRKRNAKKILKRRRQKRRRQLSW